MERLTRPDIDILQTAVRFMGAEVKIQDISDKLLHLILNGPTINSINKDTLRHLVRQLYTELKRYEDLEMTPEAIEQQLTNFSSFLMEMTGGRMSKTNYTVRAMVDEANDHFESVCDECSDRQRLAEVEKELAMVKAELNEAVQDLKEYGGCPSCKHKDASSTEEPCLGCFRSNGREDKWEWRGAKDTNVLGKEE